MYDMKYRTVALPEELIDEVEKTRNKSRLGYRSNAEFIADAVRMRIREEASRTARPSPSVSDSIY